MAQNILFVFLFIQGHLYGQSYIPSLWREYSAIQQEQNTGCNSFPLGFRDIYQVLNKFHQCGTLQVPSYVSQNIVFFLFYYLVPSMWIYDSSIQTVLNRFHLYGYFRFSILIFIVQCHVYVSIQRHIVGSQLVPSMWFFIAFFRYLLFSSIIMVLYSNQHCVAFIVPRIWQLSS